MSSATTNTRAWLAVIAVFISLTAGIAISSRPETKASPAKPQAQVVEVPIVRTHTKSRKLYRRGPGASSPPSIAPQQQGVSSGSYTISPAPQGAQAAAPSSPAPTVSSGAS